MVISDLRFLALSLYFGYNVNILFLPTGFGPKVQLENSSLFNFILEIVYGASNSNEKYIFLALDVTAQKKGESRISLSSIFLR